MGNGIVYKVSSSHQEQISKTCWIDSANLLGSHIQTHI